MPVNPVTRQHHSLHPVKHCLIRPQSKGKDHVTPHNLEHVVNQQPQEKKGYAHREFARRKPLLFHPGLELSEVFLGGAPVPVDLKGLLLSNLQARPQHIDPKLGNQQLMSLLLKQLDHFEDHTNGFLEVLDFPKEGSSVDSARPPFVSEILDLMGPIRATQEKGLGPFGAGEVASQPQLGVHSPI